MKNLSGNSVSRVWVVENRILKRQPKYLTDNEWYALHTFQERGIVPQAIRLSDDIISMELIVEDTSFDAETFLANCEKFLLILRIAGIRHGDLTRPHIFVVNSSPVVIDWAESRIFSDPRPDKRREGDWHWMNVTAEQIVQEMSNRG